jgi:hypothetical protein
MLRQFSLHDPVHVGCLDGPVLLDQMERQVAKREMVRFQRKASWSGHPGNGAMVRGGAG